MTRAGADPKLVARVVVLRRAAVATAAASAGVVLLGWLLDSRALEGWVGGRTAMKANTAVAALALAAAFLPRIGTTAPVALAAFAGAVGAASGLEIALGRDFGIDQLLFHERVGALHTASPNQMSADAALLLVLLALAVALTRQRRRLLAGVGHAAVVLACVASLLAVVGQATSTAELLSLGQVTQLSVPATVIFGLLTFAALFARLDLGATRLLIRDGFDGQVLRLALGAAIALPIGLGFVRNWLHSAGVDTGSAEWLYTVAMIATLALGAGILSSFLGQALAAVAEASARVRAIVEFSPLAVVTVDTETSVTSWNPAAERLFGWRADEVVGRPYPLAEGESRAEVVAELERASRGETLVVDRVRRRKDGSEVVVRLAVAPLRFDGRVAGMSIVLSDETDRRRAEEALARLNAELERRVAERTAALTAANAELQSFSYSISHDLRTPLRALDGFSQALLEDYGPQLDELGREHLERIRAASQRMAALIDDVLTLSRVTRADLRREHLDVSELAREVGGMIARANPEREVELVVADGIEAYADPALVRVALQNLLENAWKFTRGVDRPRVEVEPADLGGLPGFSVADNGAGFPEEYGDRLFKPFQRLHGTSEFPGNGIGLATVFNIVQRHGGGVGAESPAGGGARFTVTFDGSAAPAAPVAVGEPALVGTEMS